MLPYFPLTIDLLQMQFTTIITFLRYIIITIFTFATKQ